MAPQQLAPHVLRDLTASSSSRSSTPSTASLTSPPSENNSAGASSSSMIINPYSSQKKKKQPSSFAGGSATTFVGGAALARTKAKKKKKGNRILRPGESLQDSSSSSSQKSKDVLPSRMNTLERFFAALLRSPASDFCASSSSASSSAALWSTICERVGLDVPTAPIQAVYDCQRTHFDVRAALVLEEARHAIAEALKSQQQQQQNRNNNNRNRNNSNTTMYLTAHLSEPSNAHGHVRITFSSQRNYTRDELYNIRPGAVVQCVHRESSPEQHAAVMLGVIVTGNRDQVQTKKCFTCLFFRPDDDGLSVLTQEEEFAVTPLAPLVTELRCFEAMTVNTEKIAFLHPLLGRPSATHTRFDSTGGDDDSDHEPKNNPANSNKNNNNNSSSNSKEHIAQDASAFFHLPQLNEAQEQAATSYLHSQPNTISLVQGPPGTGKTTLLVSILCRYLTESIRDEKDSRILVSAPTNKAISVLATRFMKAIRTDRTCPCNVILVGDADKLLVDERLGSGPLQSIFLYTWIQNVVEGYTKIRAYFLPRYAGRENLAALSQLAVQLQNRLTNSLPYLSKNILNWTRRIAESLAGLQQSTTGVSAHHHDIVETTTKLLEELKDMPSDAVWTQLLLSAHVIFCTLASAGGTVLKKTSRIDDLIIDEAAASTEPELCIPFHLQPKRLLAVGDPLQLPATVLSRRAVELGLTKSLHERLMYECDYEHVMLNVQYRMAVQISSFPSQRFYASKIGNAPNVTGPQYRSGARLLDRLPYTFLQVHGTEKQSFGGSYSNRAEAQKIVELVTHLRQAARPSEHWHSAARIRVITFYQAQVVLIKRCLQERGVGNVVVATVDSSQGSEADIVLISFVRSSFQAGFLTDDRRMNVALTRAKYQLVCIGNVRCFPNMQSAETLKLLAADAEQRGVVRSPLTTAAGTIGGGGGGGAARTDDLTARLDMFYGQDEEVAVPVQKKMRMG